MRIYTLNSIYEVDEENGRFRRLVGKNDPTPYIQDDEVWHDGKVVGPAPRVGYACCLMYSDELRYTLTSTVTKVER